jgi:hypothetical protein
MANDSRYQVQVSGPWAGSVGGWRPAVDGTMNQSGRPAAEASTFATEDEAEEVMAQCQDEADEDAIRSGDEDRADDTSFRVVEVQP